MCPVAYSGRSLARLDSVLATCALPSPTRLHLGRHGISHGSRHAMPLTPCCVPRDVPGPQLNSTTCNLWQVPLHLLHWNMLLRAKCAQGGVFKDHGKDPNAPDGCNITKRPRLLYKVLLHNLLCDRSAFNVVHMTGVQPCALFQAKSCNLQPVNEFAATRYEKYAAGPVQMVCIVCGLWFAWNQLPNSCTCGASSASPCAGPSGVSKSICAYTYTYTVLCVPTYTYTHAGPSRASRSCLSATSCWRTSSGPLFACWPRLRSVPLPGACCGCCAPSTHQ